VRVRLSDSRLFVRKVVSVFALAFALLPLVSLKTDIPALTYVGSLIVLHVGVVIVYVYRVRFRELDPDWRSLTARLLALGFVIYLLFAFSKFAVDASIGVLAAQLFVLSVLHAAVLVLLMARIEYPPSTSPVGALSDEGSTRGAMTTVEPRARA